MALNRSDKSRILRRYFPGMTRNSEMSTEPNLWQASAAALFFTVTAAGISKGIRLAARRLRQWLFKSCEE